MTMYYPTSTASLTQYDIFRGHLSVKRFRQSFIGRLIGIVSPRLCPAPASSVHQVAASSESLLSGRLLPCGFRLPVCASFCPSPSLRVKGFLTGDGSIPSVTRHVRASRFGASVMFLHGWHPRLFGALEIWDLVAPPARVEPASPNPMPRPRSSPILLRLRLGRSSIPRKSWYSMFSVPSQLGS
ncbi:hypothetical protein FB451DRAFT_1280190 [Mycena latifolia]|nr:hypothetical protein FB451DRAFT_1280190 [Mycena latifolia]